MPPPPQSVNARAPLPNGPSYTVANALKALQCEKCTVKYTSADKHVLCLQCENKSWSHLPADCL